MDGVLHDIIVGLQMWAGILKSKTHAKKGIFTFEMLTSIVFQENFPDTRKVGFRV
jgi:hypothetical protein